MGALALTYDDGPDPRWTPRLLDVLAHAGALATFFPIASRAAALPALVERIVAAGHHIGLHCHEHIRHTDRDREWLARDTHRALRELAAVGVVPTLWRAPWGVTAPFTGEIAREHDLRVVGWTVDTHDWRGDRAADMLAATRHALTPGAVVLAHDGLGPGAQRDGTGETVLYTELVAAHAENCGLRLEALQ